MPERKFYRFPMLNHLSHTTLALTKRRQDLWLRALNRDNFLPSSYKNATVCNLHFISGIVCFVGFYVGYKFTLTIIVIGKSAKYTDVDNADWVPSKNLGYKKRMKRIEQIEYNNKSNEQLEADVEPMVKVELNLDDDPKKEQETQTQFLQCIRNRAHVSSMRQRDSVCRLLIIYVNL